jgi:hypothetical protein
MPKEKKLPPPQHNNNLARTQDEAAVASRGLLNVGTNFARQSDLSLAPKKWTGARVEVFAL